MKPLRLLAALLALSLSLPLVAQTKPSPALPPGVTAQRDINYADSSNKAQFLDLFLPPNPDAKPLPLIVFIHGGGWQGGDKSHNLALPFVPRGYAAASINYRFSQEAVFPAQIHDCKAALRWLRAHADKYHLDKDRVGVWGDSAGGHLVALLGTTGDVKELEGDVGKHLDQSSRVQCVVDFFGPTDMSLFWEHAEPVTNIFKAKPNESPISKLFGGPVAEKKDIVHLANPVAFVTPDDAPTLIIHGDQDALVPLAQSQILVDALKKANIEVHLEVLEGANHGGPAFGKPSINSMIIEFFDNHLKAK